MSIAPSTPRTNAPGAAPGGVDEAGQAGGGPGAAPELFFTDETRLDRPIIVDGVALSVMGKPYALPACARRAVEACCIPNAMPFMLGADGTYLGTVNAFLRALPTLGCPSRHTWRGYAYDLKIFALFLAEQPGAPTLLTAREEHVSRFKVARAIVGPGDDPERIAGKIMPSTWNRCVIALDRFYAYAASRDPSVKVPFSYKDVTVRRQGRLSHSRRNTALARGGDKGLVKCVSLADYLLFRDHGLSGLPARRDAAPFRGRNGLRDAAFAEALVTTGMRLEEGASVLLSELPDPDDPRWAGLRSCPLQLGRLTTKGDKGRRIWVPLRVLRERIRPYVEEDRDNAVAKAVAAGVYDAWPEALRVSEWRARDCVLAGGGPALRYDALDRALRARLVAVGEDGAAFEPGLLWLSEQGKPLHPATFDTVFARARERLRREAGIDVAITPHTLRHTFAVYMLAHLVRGIVERLPNLRSEKGRVSTNAYAALVMDPLRRLQRMLGHASIETTQVYLTYIEEADELVDEAIGSWSDRLGRPTDLLGPEATDG